MSRRFVIATGVLLVLALGAIVASHWLLFTEAGLAFVLKRIEHLSTVSIVAEGAQGTIASGLSAQKVTIDHEAIHIELERLSVTPDLARLLVQTAAIERLEVGRLDVTLKHRPPQPEKPPYFLPRFLTVLVGEFLAGPVRLTLENGQQFTVGKVRGSKLEITRYRLDLKDYVIEDPAGLVAGAITLRAMQPLGLRGRATGKWRLPDERDYQFSATVTGNLDRLGVDAALTQPARISFDGNALALTREPRLVGTFRVQDFDGSPWVPAGKAPPLSGSIVVDARRAGIGLDGTLTSPALGDQPLRLQGGAEYADRRLEVQSLEAWLPRSSLRFSTGGSVVFDGSYPTLALEGEWTDLRWPVVGEPGFGSAHGVYRLAGAMPYSYTIRAVTSVAMVKQASVTAAGSIDRERLVVDGIDASVWRGRMQGSGALSWTGEQPWSFDVAAREIDVAQVRPELSGRVTGHVTIAGRGLRPDAEWTANIRSLSGTLFGRALRGSGEIAHRDDGFVLNEVRITNDESRLIVDGRLGPTIDLEWDADLQSLALLKGGLSGRLVSKGKASGTAAKPDIVGRVTINDFRQGDNYAELVTADVDVDLSDVRATDIDVQARDVTAGGILFHRIGTTVQGHLAEHAIEAEIIALGDDRRRIPGFTARLAASGALDLDARSWHGELRETEINYADGSAKLLQPAALQFSPASMRVAPICLAAGESRLCAEGDWTDRPRAWHALYSAQDWPLKRVLTSLLGWREFDGYVQASGWINQEPGQPWIGGTTILLDNPTLDIPRNKFRSERVHLGGGRVDVYAELDQLRGSIDMKLGEETRVEGSVTAPRPPDVPMLDLDLHGQLHGQSAELSALPLFVPEIDYSSGSLDTSVSIGGTLGQPRFDGDFAVRNGRFELYRTNLVLSNATLDGRFAGDELTFEGGGNMATGAVRLSGRFRWPDGVMTGQMRLHGDELLVADTPEYRVLASPDITLDAGQEGILVQGTVNIPMAKIAPKELGGSVATSPDERVVGLEEEDDKPSTAERVSSRVKIVIGKDVRVESYGLKAKLGGEVTVLTKPGDVARGQGEINVIEGQYKAFGQDVKITRGRLIFDNVPLTEPVLDLVAERYIEAEDVTVAINVRGSLDEPFINITSTPAMSNNEALSYLLTGRSIDTLQSGEAQSIDTAAESLAYSGGGLLLGGIGSRLGLDELTVERTSGGDDTSVVLGKYLSPKLFISYGISVAEAINTIKLRYTLNKKWSVRAEAGLDQSADIEYRIER
jgi:translocation and assembly module TamB